MRDKGGEGVQNPENFADVLYVWSLGQQQPELSELIQEKVFIREIFDRGSRTGFLVLSSWDLFLIFSKCNIF